MNDRRFPAIHVFGHRPGTPRRLTLALGLVLGIPASKASAAIDATSEGIEQSGQPPAATAPPTEEPVADAPPVTDAAGEQPAATPATPPPAPLTLPTGTSAQAPVITGSTDLGGGTFGTVKDPTLSPEGEPLEATEASAQAGGLWTTGNSRSYLGTARGDFRLRRQIHQFEANVAGNYGGAKTKVEDPITSEMEWPKAYEPNVGNVQARLRYDIFFGQRWSAFAMGTYRYDYFQNIDARVNIDPGVAFYAINEPKHRLWFEAGYDLQFDRLSTPGSRDLWINAVRLFGGYTNQISEKFGFKTGVEYLQGVYTTARDAMGERVDDLPARVMWDTALSVQLINRLSIAASFTLRWEKRVPTDREFEPLDTLTALNLVYRIY